MSESSNHCIRICLPEYEFLGIYSIFGKIEQQSVKIAKLKRKTKPDLGDAVFKHIKKAESEKKETEEEEKNSNLEKSSESNASRPV